MVMKNVNCNILALINKLEEKIRKYRNISQNLASKFNAVHAFIFYPLPKHWIARVLNL